MSGRFSSIRARHPAAVDAVVWAVPAILFGLGLRLLLSSVQPYAYWGSDSESYFTFTYRLLTEGVGSIPEKRRYVYPLLLLPAGLLPGAALSWVLVFQHAWGLVTIIPFVYVVRKVFVRWRWWVVPVSVVYAGMPILLWYEHELLGETFFFTTLVWAFAAWIAWVGRIERGDLGRVAWWVFFAALALCVLTKPAGRFFWPGLIFGLVYLRAWRWLRWPEWVGLAALLVASWTMGQGTQASRLLYTSAWPLTQLDTAKHAELKAEIAPLVRRARGQIDVYYGEDDEAKEFLRAGYRSKEFPAWRSLRKAGGDADYSAMRDLALEGIRAEPHLFFYIALQRTVAAMNWSVFKEERFEPDYFPRKFEGRYRDLLEEPAKLRMLFGLGQGEPLPSWTEMQAILRKGENEGRQRWLSGIVTTFVEAGAFVQPPKREDGTRRTLWEMTPTWQGWWLAVGIVVSFLVPRFRGTVAVWLLVGGGYVVAVHLVGSSNPRFFAAVWPMFFVAMVVPLDWLAGWVAGRRRAV